MGSDLVALSALSKELNTALSGARVDKIVQPDPDELRFFLRNNGKNLCLCVSCNAGAPRIHITNSKKQNPINAPSLCMLLRKHLQVSNIESVSVFNNDRIIQVKFKARTEMKDDATYYLFAEIMNRYSNIVFTDENLTILDAVKHLPLDATRDHVVLRGVKYEPVAQKKTSYLTDCNDVFDTFNGGDLHKYIIENISGFSGVTVSEILHKCGLETNTVSALSTTEKDKLLSVIDEFRNITEKNFYSPALLNGKDVLPYHYDVLKDKDSCAFTTMSEAYDALFSVTDTEIRNKARLKTLNTTVKHLKNKVEKNISIDLDRLEECKNMEEYRLCGEMIVSNIYRIKKGDKQLVCDNYYTGEEMIVKLDETLTPSGNSKYYYTKYNKLKRQQEFTEKKLVNDQNLLDYVLSIENELATLPYDSSTVAIEEELEKLGVLRKKSSKGKVRKEKSEPPHKYQYGGFTILKGKNNLQNDELTFRVASGSDLWLHVKNGHGAHVIILTEGKKVPDETIKIAAEIACSDFKGSQNVDYTERRNVKRMPNGHPGQVIYVNYKTALAVPNDHTELKA